MKSESERRTARLAAARRTLAGLSGGTLARQLLADIDHAHAQVEAAERRLASAWLPALAVRTRRRLAGARCREQELLAACGFDSWLGLQLAQVDALLDPPPPEAVAAAELEHRLAEAAWAQLPGEEEQPVTDDGTGAGVASLARLAAPEGPRPAVA